MKKFVFLMCAVVALALSACSGKTTPVTNITSSTATLNGQGKCDSGTPNPCWFHFESRVAGAGAWTVYPQHGPVNGPAGPVAISENATGLPANTLFDVRLCGRGDQASSDVCVDSTGTVNGTNYTQFRTPAAGGNVVVSAVGDVCSGTSCSEGNRTGDTVRAINPVRHIGVGDFQYQDGRQSNFDPGYATAFSGLHAITNPVFGATHDTSDGSGSWEGYPVAFFNANGAPESRGKLSDGQPGYSWDINGWHVVMLNYKAGSAATTWLQNDLAAHPHGCLLAVDHAPFMGSPTSEHPSNEGAFLQSVLTANDVDLELTGHQHFYERNVSGDVTQITNGEGGIGHYSRTSTASTAVAYNSASYGVTKLNLGPNHWDTTFVPNAGASGFSDSASGDCA